MVSAVSALAIDTLLPAFSAMREAFNLPEDSTGLSLTITLFFVGSGIGNLVYGPMADSLGRKRVLVGSLVLYALASLMATFSLTLGMLYVSRFIWGFAAAGPRTASQAIVRDYYSGDAMARVMTLVMTVFFWAPVAGPPLGKGLVALLNHRALHWFRARNLALGAGLLQMAGASTMLSLAMVNGGTPPFVLWITIFSLTNACLVAFFPLGQSLALEPMGKMAGTASAVLGFAMALFGAGLAALIDQAVSGTVTPVGVGYLAYGTAAMACQLFAVRHQKGLAASLPRNSKTEGTLN